MEIFGIITALETFCVARGWHFVYGVNQFERNIQSIRDYHPDEILLIADFRIDPEYSNNKIVKARYTCLFMLGRKFESTGTSASLDESNMQKYENRLKDLMVLLSAGIQAFACENELDIISSPLAVDLNVYDENIDFVISDPTIFEMS